MKTLKVAEYMWTIQGEGARAGTPSMFVRLAGCNLQCFFCDTDFDSGKSFTVEELEDILLATLPAPLRGQEDLWIVWTGGEPTESLDADIVAYFKARGWKQAIETNGTNPVPPGIDWVCCSPKVAEHALAKSFPEGVDELRYVRHSGQPGVPQPSVKAKRYFLSPMFDGNNPNQDNLRHCVKLCLENPQWSLSLQTHKLIKVL